MTVITNGKNASQFQHWKIQQVDTVLLFGGPGEFSLSSDRRDKCFACLPHQGTVFTSVMKEAEFRIKPPQYWDEGLARIVKEVGGFCHRGQWLLRLP